MATQEQYDCFVQIFDRETAYLDSLLNRGKVYLSIVTLYFGLLGVASEKTMAFLQQSELSQVLFAGSLGAFVVAMGLIVASLGIYRGYVYPSDPERILDSYGDSWPPANDDFFDARIAELATAFTSNHRINNRRASLLRYATYFMLAGIALQGCALAVPVH